jgi:hypothetical protein
VDRITFNCHPLRGGQARVDVAADTGVITDRTHG